MLFVCYFANILAAVPKHWGVPYRNRLARYVARSRQGLIVEALNAAFSLVRAITIVDMSTLLNNTFWRAIFAVDPVFIR